MIKANPIIDLGQHDKAVERIQELCQRVRLDRVEQKELDMLLGLINEFEKMGKKSQSQQNLHTFRGVLQRLYMQTGLMRLHLDDTELLLKDIDTLDALLAELG